MVNVSRKKINKDVLESITDQFIAFISHLESDTGAHSFLFELLTHAERIKLTKRFAILVMLRKGYTFQDISVTLKVGSETIARVQNGIQEGRYDGLLEHVEIVLGHIQPTAHKKEYAALRAYFEVLFMPLPPMTRQRWRNLDKMDEIRQKYFQKKRGQKKKRK